MRCCRWTSTMADERGKQSENSQGLRSATRTDQTRGRSSSSACAVRQRAANRGLLLVARRKHSNLSHAPCLSSHSTASQPLQLALHSIAHLRLLALPQLIPIITLRL
jgi:hypothetical protein